MQYAHHDSNPKSSLTPLHLHMPSVKNRQGHSTPYPFSKTQAFCFVILDTLDTPNAYLFPYPRLCVMHLWATDFWVITTECRTPIRHSVLLKKKWTVSDNLLYFKSIGQSPINCFIQKQWTVSDKPFIQKHWTISDKLFY